MTKVDWHPVRVDRDGVIQTGKRPHKMANVYVTLSDSHVYFERYIDERYGFGDGYSSINHELIIAWSYLIIPEPYRPEAKDE